MNILFIYPEKIAGIKVYSENVILALEKYYKDINLTKLEYKEFEQERDYYINNDFILSVCNKNNINLVHIEFDFGYFGYKFYNKPFIDLITKLVKMNISYTLSLHNDLSVFLDGMKILNKDTDKFSEVLSFLKTIPIKKIIVHNPLFDGSFAPILPLDNYKHEWNKRIDFPNKTKIVLGLSGFLHNAKNYHEFLSFAKNNKNLFIEQNISINAQFNERKDRVSKDRIDYKLLLEKYTDEHINIEIIDDYNLDKYRLFLNSIDVGVFTHSVVSQSSTVTDYIYFGKPVLAKDNYNNLYLDFLQFYNNEDYLYYFIKNIRSILSKYDLDGQKLFCETYNDRFVARVYNLTFIKNIFSSFSFRLAVGALCYYNTDLLLFKKPGVPFFDILHGGINKGETNIVALKREIMEELNITENDFVIGDEICDFEYLKPLKTQLKVSNIGAKVKIFIVKLNKLPNLPTTEIEMYAKYSSNLIIYTNTKELITKCQILKMHVNQ